MGEFADWANDSMQEAYPDWMPIGDPYRAAARRFYKPPPACKHCGAMNLTWGQTTQGWRLFNDWRATELHVCNPPSADEFEALP